MCLYLGGRHHEARKRTAFDHGFTKIDWQPVSAKEGFGSVATIRIKMQRPRSFDNEWQVSYWQLSVNEIKRAAGN